MSLATDPLRRSPGPARRFDLSEIDEAALRVVEESGFAGLSLRAVARELGITAAALYTYLDNGDELRQRVIDLVIARHTDTLVWPEDWRGALRTFALGLRDLLAANPAMIEAFAAGVVLTPMARDVAEQVIRRLVGAGMSPAAAFEAYTTVHALVMGHGLLSTGAARSAPPDIDAVRHPTLALLHVERGGIGRLPLEVQLEIVITGLEPTVDGDPRP